uniref:3-hydroxyacyl-CoA dehydrogenase family protein n=1 Tax=Actibacterium sp. TaxID=1872125 RepID=UPI0035628373
KRLGLQDKPGFRYIPIADHMVDDLGRLGRKTGAGWYDYPEGAPPAPSAPVAELIRETARREGLSPLTFDAGEVQQRALTAMIEEACAILQEGIAARPADIDLVMIHGYAFPRWRGGLMHYADTIGAAELVRRIETYRAEDPLSWNVPDLLRDLAQSGRDFASLNQASGE